MKDRRLNIVEHLSDEKLQKIEDQLLKKRSVLKLKGVEKDSLKCKSVYAILNNIILLNQKFDTLYSKNNKLQCGRDKSRSQGDLFMLMRYYYPGITFKEFRKQLFKLLNDSKLSSFYCSDINKRIFFKQNSLLCASEDTYIGSLDIEDELGLKLYVATEFIPKYKNRFYKGYIRSTDSFLDHLVSEDDMYFNSDYNNNDDDDDDY